MATLPSLNGMTVTAVVADSFDPYPGSSDWDFISSAAGYDQANWRLESPGIEVAAHHDLHYDAPKKKEEKMRGLYRIIAVDYKNDEVVVDEEVIADNERHAELKALAGIVNDYDLGDLDIKTIKVMDVRKSPDV